MGDNCILDNKHVGILFSLKDFDLNEYQFFVQNDKSCDISENSINNRLHSEKIIMSLNDPNDSINFSVQNVSFYSDILKKISYNEKTKSVKNDIFSKKFNPKRIIEYGQVFKGIDDPFDENTGSKYKKMLRLDGNNFLFNIIKPFINKYNNIDHQTVIELYDMENNSTSETSLTFKGGFDGILNYYFCIDSEDGMYIYSDIINFYNLGNIGFGLSKDSNKSVYSLWKGFNDNLNTSNFSFNYSYEDADTYICHTSNAMYKYNNDLSLGVLYSSCNNVEDSYAIGAKVKDFEINYTNNQGINEVEAYFNTYISSLISDTYLTYKNNKLNIINQIRRLIE